MPVLTEETHVAWLKNHCTITKKNVILYKIDIEAGGYYNIWTQVK